MQLMFQRLRNAVLCASCIMPLHGTMRTMQQFSLHGLASLCKPLDPAPTVLVKPDTPPVSTSWITVERAHNVLSIAACVYVAARIAYNYQQGFGLHKKMTVVNKTAFAFNSAVIIGEALVIKSLAKLLLLCATGDITDLIEQAIKRCKKMVIG